jgi:hypothetical protein
MRNIGACFRSLGLSLSSALCQNFSTGTHPRWQWAASYYLPRRARSRKLVGRQTWRVCFNFRSLSGVATFTWGSGPSSLPTEMDHEKGIACAILTPPEETALRTVPGAPELARNHLQSSICNPGTRANSFVLLVTKVAPKLSAWAAMKVSKAPIAVPEFSRTVRTFP